MLKPPRLNRSNLAIWLGAFTGFYRPDAEEVAGLDTVSRFLFAARSVILVISVQAALIAWLAAATSREFHWLNALLVLLGYSIAHLISNLSNDYFGFRHGHDTPDSPRMRYTVHPLASGVLTPTALAIGLALLSIAGIAIAAYFVFTQGWLAALFAFVGIVILFWYDAAPVPLKSIGLGEIAVFIVWGPLMVAGGYAMISGHPDALAFYISLPHGLGVMSILIGKHIDQRDFDLNQGIRTLPVILGAHKAQITNMLIIIGMYLITITLIGLDRLSPFVVICLFALPRALHALRTLSRPAPPVPPPGYTGWPLWYHRVCLLHHRRFAWLYILGLALGAIWPSLQL